MCRFTILYSRREIVQLILYLPISRSGTGVFSDCSQSCQCSFYFSFCYVLLSWVFWYFIFTSGTCCFLEYSGILNLLLVRVDFLSILVFWIYFWYVLLYWVFWYFYITSATCYFIEYSGIMILLLARVALLSILVFWY